MEQTSTRFPKAREAGLLTAALPEGLMVYDTERDQAHYINRTAALVWHACDGRTPVADLATLLQQELALPPDEAVVELALKRLAVARLLAETGSLPVAGVLRRSLVRKLGLAGGMAALLPLVQSLVAPTPAAAQSPAGNGGGGGGGVG